MTDPSTNPPPRDLGVIAVPFSGGQGKPGVSSAPTFLQNAGLLTQLTEDLNYTIHHSTISPPAPPTTTTTTTPPTPPIRNMKNAPAVSTLTRALATVAHTHVRAGRLLLTLGGDHSIAMGSVAGVARGVRERAEEAAQREGRELDVAGGEGEVGLIWVDAHADINTPESSGSGNVHGMPVAFLTGLAQQRSGAKEETETETETGEEEEPFAWLPTSPPALPLANLVYIGLRSVDRGEKALLRAHRVKAFSMHDIDALGIAAVVDGALAYLPPKAALHLSVDVDALDPAFAPSTGTPVRGGLTLREGDFIAERVWGTGRVVGVDLVEVNPLIGEEVAGGLGDEGGWGRRAVEETVRAGVSLVRCALGDTLL